MVKVDASASGRVSARKRRRVKPQTGHVVRQRAGDVVEGGQHGAVSGEQDGVVPGVTIGRTQEVGRHECLGEAFRGARGLVAQEVDDLARGRAAVAFVGGLVTQGLAQVLGMDALGRALSLEAVEAFHHEGGLAVEVEVFAAGCGDAQRAQGGQAEVLIERLVPRGRHPGLDDVGGRRGTPGVVPPSVLATREGELGLTTADAPAFVGDLPRSLVAAQVRKTTPDPVGVDLDEFSGAEHLVRAVDGGDLDGTWAVEADHGEECCGVARPDSPALGDAGANLTVGGQQPVDPRQGDTVGVFAF